MTTSPPAPRSRRMLVLWSIALALLLAAGLFSWLVVVPVWQVRSAVHAAMDAGHAQPSESNPEELTVKAAGGPAMAAELWRRYDRLPEFIAPRKRNIFFLWTLAYCGPHSVPQLIELLEDAEYRLVALHIMVDLGTDAAQAVRPVTCLLRSSDKDVRKWALNVLYRLGPGASGSAPEVIHALADTDRQVRVWAVAALAEIEAEPKEAIPALKTALSDEDAWVREYAAEALKKIKAAQEKKDKSE